MTDLTPNHPAVEAAARAMHAAYERRAERWEAFYTRTPWEAIGEDSQAEFIGYVHQPLNAAIPHLTADDLPTCLVRDIQVRTIRATARAATYDEGGIPGDHYWDLGTVAAWLDGLADNIEEEADHA